MTVRKHNDAKGYKRGEGAYSSGKSGLVSKTYVVKKNGSVDKTATENGERNAGFAAKIDKY